MSTKKIATLIMAAGSSSRMGEPKQLLKWKDTTLIETAISTTLELGCENNIVILGAYYNKIKPTVENCAVKTIYNKDWKKGLGNSIAFGVKHIQNSIRVDGVLIVLADQPLIESAYLREIVDSFKINNDRIIATQYQNGNLGVPALFDKCYFRELSTIDGDKGAKDVINSNIKQIKTLTFKVNTLDIDTAKEYAELSKQYF